eukprot:1033937-Alexandrium_andersonii.AAC.1
MGASRIRLSRARCWQHLNHWLRAESAQRLAWHWCECIFPSQGRARSMHRAWGGAQSSRRGE